MDKVSGVDVWWFSPTAKIRPAHQKIGRGGDADARQLPLTFFDTLEALLVQISPCIIIGLRTVFVVNIKALRRSLVKEQSTGPHGNLGASRDPSNNIASYMRANEIT